MTKPWYTDQQIADRIKFNTRPEDPSDWFLRSWSQGPVLTYSVPATSPDPSDNNGGGNDENDGFVFLAQEQAWSPLARKAFEAWDELIALSLLAVEDTGANITLAWSTNTRDGGSYMSPNTDSVGDDEEFNQAQIWLNPTWGQFGTATLPNGINPVRTGYPAYETFLHEVGHALGLFHPGPYDASDEGDETYAEDAVFQQDTKRFSIMSYFGEKEDGSGADWKGWRPMTPMVYDILAIQQKYGADPNTRAGNDTYGFNATVADTITGGGALDPVYNFSVSTRPVLTIYDAGGVDTLDLSSFTTSQIVNLRPGSYSSVSDLKLNLGIAFGTWIENVRGGTWHDTIYGNDLDNVIEGGRGWDDMAGFGGYDTASYANAAGAVRADLANRLLNRGEATGDIFNSIEALLGGNFGDTLSGDVWDNRLTGGGGNDRLDGQQNQDTLIGGAGADTLIGGPGADRLYGDGLSAFDPSGPGDLASYATSGAAVFAQASGFFTPWMLSSGGDAQGDWLVGIEDITGSRFNDTLSGGAVDNVLRGGAGNDELRGNEGDDSLYGDAGNDVLKGGFGRDRLDGFTGIDTASYADAFGPVSAWLSFSDAMLLNSGEALGDLYYQVENLRGSDYADTLGGDEFANQLDGGFGLDDLRGGSGNDVYVLGDVFDWYSGQIFVGAFRDQVTEAADAGVDTVLVTAAFSAGFGRYLSNYTLGANVENGVVIGSIGFSLVGNIHDNRLTGGTGNDRFVTGDGADTLDGGLGWDTLYGEFGDDTYVIGDIFDWYSGEIYVGAFRDDVLEPLNGGTDTVIVTAAYSAGFNRFVSSYTLGANVENGVVTGTRAFTLVGNVLDNRLTGGGGNDRMVAGDGADTLEGGFGADTLFGEFGDDTYILKDVTRDSGDGIFPMERWDTILEAAPGGVDTVLIERAPRATGFESWRSDYTLPDFIENARVTGSGNFTLTGNVLDNRITGNADFNFLVGQDGADSLFGMGGDDALNGGHHGDRLVGGEGADTLNGAQGRDTLTGGTEADIFVFGATADNDAVSDFVAGEDRVLLALAAFDPGGALGFAAGSLAGQAGRFLANTSGLASTAGLAQVTYETDAGRLWFDADGAGGAARQLVATFLGLPAISAAEVWMG
jgi:Ca2+-binding RTX toxin-like protein